MSDEFRALLRKVGSGTHTSKALTREEAARAAALMLTQAATPAQIGAFMIAHRIKRPTGDELTGFLDTYEALGPKLQPISTNRIPLLLNSPYDGRSRTAPIRPLTTLILAAAGCPVISHGGDRTPTKYGIPLSQIWRDLGCDWSPLSLTQVQQVFEQTHIAFVYTPTLFPLAHGLVTYREQIGKRPPLATIELIWYPYAGDAVIAAGFVHPPTEQTAQYALTCHRTHRFIMVKGMEGSCDLPRDRTAIIGRIQNGEFQRLHRNPYDYDFGGKNPPIPETTPQLIHQMQRILEGKPSELMHSAIWNGGFYLWHCGFCPDIATGFDTAEILLSTGKVNAKLQEVMRINS